MTGKGNPILLGAILLLNTLAVSAVTLSSAMPTVAVPVACTPPKYPKTSIRFGEAPVVGLTFLIDANGAVLKARIVETSGAKIIDDSTRVALSRCTYPPIRVAGKAVGGWVYVRYEWVIE